MGFIYVWLEKTSAYRWMKLEIIWQGKHFIFSYYRKFCGNVGQHISLDIEYIELIPKMYSNEMSQVRTQLNRLIILLSALSLGLNLLSWSERPAALFSLGSLEVIT